MPEEGRWVTGEEKGGGKDSPLLASEILAELFPQAHSVCFGSSNPQFAACDGEQPVGLSLCPC